MTHAEISFAVIVGLISAGGIIAAARLTKRGSDTAARLSAEEMKRQASLNAALKIAEFRQAWINNLRTAMTRFIAICWDPKHSTAREAFEAGTMIELLMNRGDERYPRLTEYMKDFTKALASGTEYDSTEFLALCQDILKREWEVLKSDLRTVNLAP